MKEIVAILDAALGSVALDIFATKNQVDLVTPVEALADIHGYARAGRVEFTRHAFVRARQRRVRVDEVVEALAYAWACRSEEGDKWRASCVDADGDLLEVIVLIEDGLLVVTLF